MISDKDLQSSYIDLYKSMRRYIWDYYTVEVLANLEVEVFKKFPDRGKLLAIFRNLKSLISEMSRDDTDFNDAVNDFESTIEYTDIYSRLKTFQEVS